MNNPTAASDLIVYGRSHWPQAMREQLVSLVGTAITGSQSFAELCREYLHSIEEQLEWKPEGAEGRLRCPCPLCGRGPQEIYDGFTALGLHRHLIVLECPFLHACWSLGTTMVKTVDNRIRRAIATSWSKVEKPPRPVGDLYVVQNPRTSAVKIGRSTNVRNRVRNLSTQSGENLKLLFHFKGHGDLEDAFHVAFDNKRILGEWFALTEDELATIPNKLGDYQTRKQ